jgi:hypothetical protein
MDGLVVVEDFGREDIYIYIIGIREIPRAVYYAESEA